jgi:hypothetical protein
MIPWPDVFLIWGILAVWGAFWTTLFAAIMWFSPRH